MALLPRYSRRFSSIHSLVPSAVCPHLKLYEEEGRQIQNDAITSSSNDNDEDDTNISIIIQPTTNPPTRNK